VNNCAKGFSERVSECEKTLINEGYKVFSHRNKLYKKNDIEYAIIYFGYIVYVRYYPRSVNILILASKFGEIYSYNPEKDTLKKVGYGVNKNGYRTAFLPTGVYNNKGYLIYLHRTVSSVVLWAWTQKKPTVNELKVIKGIGTKVKMYNTVIIAEFQNKHHTNDEDYYLSNLEWNFVKRGKRHWKAVIGNDPVKDARGLMLRGEFPSNREFKERWDLSVSDSAISAMKYGNTWQVRTEPIAPMTNPMENLKDNIG
jgi:hypothetical protein